MHKGRWIVLTSRWLQRFTAEFLCILLISYEVLSFEDGMNYDTVPEGDAVPYDGLQSGTTPTRHENVLEAPEPELTRRAGAFGLSDEKRLIKHLLENYDKVGIVGRPVFNKSQTINVEYGVGLIQILDIDERNQVLTTNIWCRYRWTDILLRWKPADYGDVSTVRVPSDRIWKPDIVLYNYADTRLREHRDAMAVVTSDGVVMWIPMAIFKSVCPIDITHFPFDEQGCDMKFGSWTYDGFHLDINFFDGADEIDLNDYMRSHEWDVLAHPAAKNIKRYPCCDEPYPDLTFQLRIKRKVAFYNYILILPCVLLSTLTLVLFWLPPESPAKMVLGMNIFVAFFLLLLLLADSTPPAASKIPLIGAYYCLNMIMITLSTFLSVIVINLYFRGDRKNRVPKLCKRIMIDGLARVLCMNSEITGARQVQGRYKRRSASPSTRAGDSGAHHHHLGDTSGESQHRKHGHHYGPQSVFGHGTAAASKHHRRNSQRGQPSEPCVPEMRYNKFQMTDVYPRGCAEPVMNHYGLVNPAGTPAGTGQNQTSPTGPQGPASAYPPGQEGERILTKADRDRDGGGAGEDYSGPQAAQAQPLHTGGGGFVHSEYTPDSPVDKSPVLRFQSSYRQHVLEQDVHEIRRSLRILIQRLHDKDAVNRITVEWRLVALVLDRLFFFAYLTAIIVSLATMFPKSDTETIAHGKEPMPT